jgi:Arc/MetJ-type ribon-helix-helix transcriptional regulator
MKDAMISVRMPVSLIEELKDLSQKNHYVDLSEQIRDIIRQKCANYDDSKPASSQIPTHQLNQNQSSSQNIAVERAQLVQELQTIIEQLKKGI